MKSQIDKQRRTATEEPVWGEVCVCVCVFVCVFVCVCGGGPQSDPGLRIPFTESKDIVECKTGEEKLYPIYT